MEHAIGLRLFVTLLTVIFVTQAGTQLSDGATATNGAPGTHAGNAASQVGGVGAWALLAQPRAAGTPVQVSLMVSPNTANQGSQVNFQAQASMGTAPYSYAWSWSGSSPGSCSPPGNGPTASWFCNPSSSGTFSISVTVTDSTSVTAADSRTFTVNPNNGGNGGGGKNSGGNNSSGFSIPLFKSLSSLLPILIIAGVAAYVLLVITAVSSLSTTILLARRLPPRSKANPAPETVACPSCGSRVPVGSKFCSQCAKPIAEAPG